ncbi:RNA-directed DNA polymerase, eukaryota, reverse transcriptase zinc-binding domain protein [Tanacetum coccineum]
MGILSSQPHTKQPMSPIHAFPIEDVYSPEFSDSFQHTGSFQETAREDSPVEVATPPPNSKSKLTRGRQKRMYMESKKKLYVGEREMEDGAPKCGSVCEVYGNVMRRVLGKVAARDTRHYGSSSFNTEFGEASINLNVDVGDDEEDEVQEIRRPSGKDKAKGYMKKKGSRSSGSSSTNEEALARLMVSELAMHNERAIEYIQRQEDMRFYMQPYDHLTGDALNHMEALRAEIKAKYNLPYEFGDMWCGWIQSCLRLSRGSVIVNGSLTREFQFRRVLKQGDHLSPFLFILIMESLYISVQRVVDAGMFRGISMGLSLHLSYLFYADDAFFMGHWSDSNIDIIVQAAAKIGCATLEAPFSYLGSKVGGLMSRIQSWNEIVNNLVARLSNWKMKTLSIGDRLTLLKSVLGSMPIYHMSLFKVPMKVLQRMESIRCHFFNGVDHNGKKPIWVKWCKVLASKEKGGLGVSSFYALNRALLFKWVWRFRTQRSSLWAMEDVWRGDGAFKSLYPIIYALETCKNVTVAVKMSHKNVGYSLRRIPRGGIEQVQFLEFLASMEDVALVDMRDK